MNTHDDKIIVGLYLRGDDLDPLLVTNALGVNPSRSQYRGERKITSKNREYIVKIGMWELISDANSNILSDHMGKLISKIGGTSKIDLLKIPNVQEAYFDVFIAGKADEDGEGTCEFELSKENLTAIENVGLPVRFTVAIVNE